MKHSTSSPRMQRIILTASILFLLSFIPMKIISLGYLPKTDPLAHATKVASGREWKDILVLRREIKVDNHPGWYQILGAVHKITGWDAHSLVTFSVIFFFMLLSIVPMLFLELPEAWLLGIIIVIAPNWFYTFRILEGRPFLLTSAAIIAICALWMLKHKLSRRSVILITSFIIALATWIHAGWYLFAIPILAFVIARRFRDAALMVISLILGVAAGALFTGHPLLFLKQTTCHPFFVFNKCSEWWMPALPSCNRGEATISF